MWRALLLLYLAACWPTRSPAEPAREPIAAEPAMPSKPAPDPSPEPALEPEPAPASAVAPVPIVEARLLSPEERAAMVGVSWREGCPVALDDLRALTIAHHTPGGGADRGTLIVHRDVANDVAKAFRALHRAGFPITRMRPVRHYNGSDHDSMAADNTSAFNCRPVGGSATWSEHAYGRAIDLNPLRNPFVRGDRVQPPSGRSYLARDAKVPGLITPGSAAVRAFADIGWGWGGSWRSSKDYQHFSQSGR